MAVSPAIIRSRARLRSFGAALAAAILLMVGVEGLALPFPILIASLILFARMNAPAQMLQNSLLQAAAYARLRSPPSSDGWGDR